MEMTVLNRYHYDIELIIHLMISLGPGLHFLLMEYWWFKVLKVWDEMNLYGVGSEGFSKVMSTGTLGLIHFCWKEVLEYGGCWSQCSPRGNSVHANQNLKMA